MLSRRSFFDLHYGSASALAAHREKSEAATLGVITFGRELSQCATPFCPHAGVCMRVFNDEPLHEIWSTQASVEYGHDRGIDFARSAEIMFGTLTSRQPQGKSLETAIAAAYGQIFDVGDAHGYAHLLRVWHYFGDINQDEEGLERYRRFSIGRHEAFAARRGAISESAPAACALGSQGDDLVFYFIASRSRGVPIENPRQTSAYHYPAQYGPRSPTFARGMLVPFDEGQVLFISGTSSIVGHESMHAGSIVDQTRETAANIRAVQEQAALRGFRSRPMRSLFKVYVRHAEDLGAVRETLAQDLAELQQIVYLQADICRAELLLEIEGVCFA